MKTRDYSRTEEDVAVLSFLICTGEIISSRALYRHWYNCLKRSMKYFLGFTSDKEQILITDVSGYGNMRNINELIGIIKGINFDGVINDKEVVRLQSWVDRNRNIAYEQKQVELIKIVDAVLEDNIIDENEKEQLIKSAESFLDDTDEYSGRIYELNGIIEGIICDGEVNEAEVHNLNSWMEEYGDLIHENKQAQELHLIIDDILEDGVVTEEEQVQLLELLNTWINSAQFESKLEYLCRLVKERKNIGVDLIDILNNESAMAEIHRRAERQLIISLNSTNGLCPNPEIIVVSLVLIAMLEYNGNYYSSVRLTYKTVYYRYSEQKVEGLIRSILGRYKKQKDSGTRSRIINVALENAIVPKNFLAAFFEFMFDIYKLNFEYDLPEDPYDDFAFVYDGLRTSMLSEGDDISINVTQKTYKLIASTKKLIVKEDGLDAVIKLSILIAKLIEKRFWNKEIKIFNPYLKAGFEGWEKQLKDLAPNNHSKKKYPKEFRSRWEPKYLLRDNCIFIVPPTHRIKAQYDYRKVAIEVTNAGNTIYFSKDFDIREIIGGYQINPPQIELELPLGRVRYKLKCGDETIYDSKDKLWRDFIVFNHDGQEVKNNTDYEGTAFFCYKPGDAEFNSITEKENYCIGYKNVKLGEAYRIGDDVINFSSLVKPGVFGELHKNCFVIIDRERRLSVYKDASVVVFEANNKSSKFEMKINGKPYKLSEMNCKATERNNITKYVVELGLEKSGFYTVEINQILDGKKCKILKEEFILDKELSFGSEFLDENRVALKVRSGIISKNINTEITIFEVEIGMINFKLGIHQCEYILPFDLGLYSIDDNEWVVATSDIWIDDISLESRMIVYDSRCDGALLYSENGDLSEDSIAIKDYGAYKEIQIGFMKSYQARNRYVTLVLTANGKRKYAILCYNRSVIDVEGTEILFVDNPKRVMVTPVFHGKNKVFFEMMDQKGEKVYTSKALISGQTETINCINSFEEYIIRFYEKTKALILQKNTLLHAVKRTFYAREDLKGRTFKISTAYFDKYIGNQCIEKEYHFNKMYLKITETRDDNYLEGLIIVKTMRGTWVLNNISPVEVEICSKVVDDTIDVYMTNCGDGLLMDFEKHGIMNSLNHPTAPDIFLYTLNLKEGKREKIKPC